jgi:hypothetical protein
VRGSNPPRRWTQTAGYRQCLALQLLRLIVNIGLGRAVATGRALVSMTPRCDRSSVAFTAVHRTASTAAPGGSWRRERSI